MAQKLKKTVLALKIIFILVVYTLNSFFMFTLFLFLSFSGFFSLLGWMEGGEMKTLESTGEKIHMPALKC